MKKTIFLLTMVALISSPSAYATDVGTDLKKIEELKMQPAVKFSPEINQHYVVDAISDYEFDLASIAIEPASAVAEDGQTASDEAYQSLIPSKDAYCPDDALRIRLWQDSNKNMKLSSIKKENENNINYFRSMLR